uniref:DNA replication licensing factor MCM3 n=1 Tax=Chromera velia CCMP2878 TaxID=1169474 RepID=A0A0G4I513_9ALVE|eukprot:Cvel_10988.t1-p1 / transcript=Cvel_10988.t1 / gene=Cvel_10988 / organism=Chromera_velia_CCMP2878 / gene_product=DNA replication licensing factor MCM3 homolog 1, putative / transcript_product=DNA replication licensing factor MCM3 homolog 1, putative / location=Cvel_scaffold676:48727-52500(+) / protein_length=952 / sequence_SO=supercontig / SO=protein_coding / is_pseudo=false
MADVTPPPAPAGAAAPADNNAQGARNRVEQIQKNIELWMTNFLQNPKYKEKLEEMVANKNTRMTIDMKDLGESDQALAKRLMKDPCLYIQPYERAVTRELQRLDTDFAKEMKEPIRIGFQGAFGRHHVTPRGLNASLVSSLVCVEGIVAKATFVRPKLVRSCYYNESNGNWKFSYHTDVASLAKDRSIAGSAGAPTVDQEDGTEMTVEYGLCTYKPHQKFTLQELPERAPTGQMPRSIDVYAEEDLVDTVKPGDRVRVVGIFRPMAFKEGAVTNGQFKCVLISNNVQQMSQEILAPTITPNDVAAIRMIADRDDTLELLGRSFAPSICGHHWLKKGLVLQSVGGNEKVLKNGAHLRGDLHVMLIGDPSCGKSQMLRFCMNIAPLAISTTGRGASGVGLTAAVTFEKETKERRLEAGAMVLADRGLVCIDEFDKMSLIDRVAIHEVMEQQTVTIAKAGIHCSLNARCSVVAAANPIYGNFQEDQPIDKQIAFPDSLLSRFDMIFVIRDRHDQNLDQIIANHVLKQNQYRSGLEGRGGGDGADVGRVAVLESAAEQTGGRVNEDGDTEVFERYASRQGQEESGEEGGSVQILTVDFLRKYIHFCKNHRQPRLSEEAVEEIADFYAELRKECNGKTQARRKVPVTARTLEACIRIATAHAKLKLRDSITVDDVRCAKQMILVCLLGDQRGNEFLAEDDEEVEQEEEEEGENVIADSSDEEDDDDEEGDGEGGDGARPPAAKRRRLRRQDDGEEGETEEGDEAADAAAAEAAQRSERRKRRSAAARAAQQDATMTGEEGERRETGRRQRRSEARQMVRASAGGEDSQEQRQQSGQLPAAESGSLDMAPTESLTASLTQSQGQSSSALGVTADSQQQQGNQMSAERVDLLRNLVVAVLAESSEDNGGVFDVDEVVAKISSASPAFSEEDVKAGMKQISDEEDAPFMYSETENKVFKI